LFLLIHLVATAQSSIWVGLSGSVRIAGGSDMQNHLLGLNYRLFSNTVPPCSISYSLLKTGIPVLYEFNNKIQVQSGVDLIFRDFADYGRYDPVNTIAIAGKETQSVGIPMNLHYKFALNEHVSISPFLGYYLEVWGNQKSINMFSLVTDSTSDGLVLNSRSRLIHYIDPGIALEADTPKRGRLRITLQSFINIRDNFSLDAYSSTLPTLGVKLPETISSGTPLHYVTFSVQYFWRLKKL
jgi:hypothetical protein